VRKAREDARPAETVSAQFAQGMGRRPRGDGLQGALLRLESIM
jgi:hypothetical protein